MFFYVFFDFIDKKFDIFSGLFLDFFIQEINSFRASSLIYFQKKFDIFWTFFIQDVLKFLAFIYFRHFCTKIFFLI